MSDRRKRRPGHQGNGQEHAHLDHHPEHERSLAEDLAPQLLVEDGIGPVGHEVDALGRGEQLVGEEVAVDHHADRVLHLLFLVDHVLALAAHVGRMEQPAVDEDGQDRPDRQTPGRKHGDRHEIAGDDVVGPGQRDAEHGQRKDHQVADDQRRAGPPEVARAGHAQEPEGAGRQDQHQVAAGDLREEQAPQQEAEDHQRQAGENQDHQIGKRAQELADQDRPRLERAGQEHLVGLPLLLAGDAPRGERRRHERDQEELAEEEDVEEPPSHARADLPSSSLAGRPVEVHKRPQRGDVEKLEHEGAGRPEVHQQFTSQDGVVAKQHDAF